LPSSWSPDGKILAFWGVFPETLNDIWLLDVQSEEGPQPFVTTSAQDLEARFSPDGRWIAYESDESGERQVYVRAYPGPGGRIQISNETGYDPLWSPDQRELFYRNARDIIVVKIQTNPDFQASKPTLLFTGQELGGARDYRSWDIMPDGQGFVAVESAPEPTELVVVLNWFEELKRLVPTN
jgi:serine/threonine-protein kinase